MVLWATQVLHWGADTLLDFKVFQFGLLIRNPSQFPGLLLVALQRQPAPDAPTAFAEAEDAEHDDRLPLLHLAVRLLWPPGHRHRALAPLSRRWPQLSCRPAGDSDQVDQRSKTTSKTSSRSGLAAVLPASELGTVFSLIETISATFPLVLAPLASATYTAELEKGINKRLIDKLQFTI